MRTFSRFICYLFVVLLCASLIGQVRVVAAAVVEVYIYNIVVAVERQILLL